MDRRGRAMMRRWLNPDRAGWLYLIGAAIGAWFTKQAFRPVPPPKPQSGLSFFAGWLTNELAVHHLLWQTAATGYFARRGALRRWTGRAALGLSVSQWIGMLLLIRRALRTQDVVTDALKEGLRGDLDPIDRDEVHRRVRRRWLLLPVASHPEVESTWNRTYAEVDGEELELDLHLPKEPGERRPVILYLHGGAWYLGYREHQGLPLLRELAGRGWVGVNADYRLSPKATFPDHLVDVKRAIAWIREHADELGADPDFIAVSGGSAGGHLAALAALTANDPRYQPGFEDADTSVQAFIPIYGVYDFLDRNGHHGFDHFRRFVELVVMKVSPDDDPEAYRRASPLDQVGAHAPPAFIIHGEKDTLAATGDARLFADELRAVSDNAVVYAELPGAQHAFDVFPSLRTSYMLDGVVSFLEHVRANPATRSGETTMAPPERAEESAVG